MKTSNIAPAVGSTILRRAFSDDLWSTAKVDRVRDGVIWTTAGNTIEVRAHGRFWLDGHAAFEALAEQADKLWLDLDEERRAARAADETFEGIRKQLQDAQDEIERLRAALEAVTSARAVDAITAGFQVETALRLFA